MTIDWTTQGEGGMGEDQRRIRVTGLDRLRNSRNGNPRYEIVHEEGVLRTRTDANFAHALTDRIVGRTVLVSVDGRGAVYGLTEV